MWRTGYGIKRAEKNSAPGLLAGAALVIFSFIVISACEVQKPEPAAAAERLTAVDGNRWQIVSVEGDTASWRQQGGPWQVATTGDILLPASEMKLGAGSSAALASGGDRIVVAENSEVAVPADGGDGRVKRILQSLGTMLLRIETRSNGGGFQVKTPYLVATVKGTEFAVTVEENNASVSVTEGVVGVDAGDGSGEVDVTPGQTASVSPDAGVGVNVNPTPAGAVPPGLVESLNKRAAPAANAPVGPGANRGKGNTSPGTSQGQGSANSNAGGNSAGSNAGGNSGNSNAGGNSGNSNAGGNSGNSNAGGNSGNSNAGGNSGNSNAGGNGGGNGKGNK